VSQVCSCRHLHVQVVISVAGALEGAPGQESGSSETAELGDTSSRAAVHVGARPPCWIACVHARPFLPLPALEVISLVLRPSQGAPAVRHFDEGGPSEACGTLSSRRRMCL
jgi:hypothetical protein